jgi:hypothetical protein
MVAGIAHPIVNTQTPKLKSIEEIQNCYCNNNNNEKKEGSN